MSSIEGTLDTQAPAHAGRTPAMAQTDDASFVASPAIGRVLGTQDSTPLEFWAAVEPGNFVQLDEVVSVSRILPTGETLRLYGVVDNVRARHEGARFDSDVFLISQGLLPAEVCESAHIMVTRCNPEIFVPPIPGEPVMKAEGLERENALYFDSMRGKLPIGLSRDGEPMYVSLDFLDGTKGAHMNISGISGVATKTSFALFVLHGLFRSGVLATEGQNSKALIFNVKGEDLLFLDKPNTGLTQEHRERYAKLGLPAEPFQDVAFWSPPRQGDKNAAPSISSRNDGAVSSFYWSLLEFCKDGLLPFLFVDADDERRQYTTLVQTAAARLRNARSSGAGGVEVEGESAVDFDALVELVCGKMENDQGWNRGASSGTVDAFNRRLRASVFDVQELVRSDRDAPSKDLERQVTVVDIHNLRDRAQRFVVGVMLRKTLEAKASSGSARPLWFVVLDELNKYAPREGTSPIKEVLVDIAERGRSLGMVLIGAQQTASEVERRVTGMAAIRVVGRLDSAESGRADYGFLRGALADRSTILKPGSMIVSQPLIPVPLVVEFPFPAWATRRDEAGTVSALPEGEDPFTRF